MAKEDQSAQAMQEMQIIEQNMQNIMMQKQAFQYELTETQSALSEVKKSGDDIYKIVGQLMLKSKKEEVVKDLENKEKLLDMRLKSFEKQEEKLSSKLEELREKLM